MLRSLAALALLLLCAGCGWFAPKDHFGARRVAYGDLAGWADDDHAQARDAFIVGCEPLGKRFRPATSESHIEVPVEVWQSLCKEAEWSKEQGEPARLFFETRFVPFRVNNNGKEEGLFTGYYEPLLFGSKRRHGDFVYPLYALPPDAKPGVPYYTHAEINAGALKGRKLEIVWVDDPVMRFFMQVQGSGRVRLEDGSEMFVGYAGGNGQPYVALGKVMADEGLLAKDQINFFTLRQWLYDHPAQAMALMERNPSYVFFKEREQGATGAIGAALTPGRSLAVDNRFIPYGLPLYLETRIPTIAEGVDAPFDRLLMAQDTGGAIRGPVRGDIFFGPGYQAEYLAGYMKGRGGYTLLVPGEIIDQLQ